MSHLFELLTQLPVSSIDDCELPDFLLGSFRRKSITFFNGKTDEQTIVYWFQSKSFSIDLRLNNAQETPISERQGWIGDTLWNKQTELLSWNIQHSYQTRIQWPEPAKISQVGNCILEFAPSGAYVEDWRQQADTGIFLGLRLNTIKNTLSNETYQIDGGLIITGDLIAYVQSRLPEVQQKCQKVDDFDQALHHKNLTLEDINQYETSVALSDARFEYSTIDERVGQKVNLDGFVILPDGRLCQQRLMNNIIYLFYYDLDFYSPHFNFVTQSLTSDVAMHWSEREQKHLFNCARIVL